MAGSNHSTIDPRLVISQTHAPFARQGGHLPQPQPDINSLHFGSSTTSEHLRRAQTAEEMERGEVILQGLPHHRGESVQGSDHTLYQPWFPLPLTQEHMEIIDAYDEYHIDPQDVQGHERVFEEDPTLCFTQSINLARASPPSPTTPPPQLTHDGVTPLIHVLTIAPDIMKLPKQVARETDPLDETTEATSVNEIADYFDFDDGTYAGSTRAQQDWDAFFGPDASKVIDPVLISHDTAAPSPQNSLDLAEEVREGAFGLSQEGVSEEVDDQPLNTDEDASADAIDPQTLVGPSEIQETQELVDLDESTAPPTPVDAAGSVAPQNVVDLTEGTDDPMIIDLIDDANDDDDNPVTTNDAQDGDDPSGAGDPHDSNASDGPEASADTIIVDTPTRLIRACIFCWKARKGCDHRIPCARCVRAGRTADDCKPHPSAEEQRQNPSPETLRRVTPIGRGGVGKSKPGKRGTRASAKAAPPRRRSARLNN